MSYKLGDRSCQQLKIENLKIGDTAELQHLLTEQDVKDFGALTGDFNPLHIDPEFARQVGFGKPVVYGMLSASFISTLIGMCLPAKGALWASQALQFLAPSFV